jgi:F0F1-type ATP synthase alpha subunit
MAIKSDEIISILKAQIEGFDGSAESRTVGTVVEVGDGIAQVYGLSGALSSELLEFPKLAPSSSDVLLTHSVDRSTARAQSTQRSRAQLSASLRALSAASR